MLAQAGPFRVKLGGLVRLAIAADVSAQQVLQELGQSQACLLVRRLRLAEREVQGAGDLGKGHVLTDPAVKDAKLVATALFMQPTEQHVHRAAHQVLDPGGVESVIVLGDGVNSNDVPYLTSFPYVALPAEGYADSHGVVTNPPQP